MSHRSIAQRAVRRLSTLRRMRPGTKRINVRQLISPLRYDVVVRARLLADLRSRDPAEPMASLQDFALNHVYFAWFKEVESMRFFPDLLDDPDLLIKRYQMRVARAVTTLRSYDAVGFDVRYPLTLGQTSGGAVTDSGVRVNKLLHIRDGCHRLALLLLDEQDLQPGMYRVHSFTGPVPDNTALLLPHLIIDGREYTRFVSAGFTTGEYTELAELRDKVAQESPHRLAELDEVVRVHQRAQGIPPKALP
jgi:hypothetical protein